MRMKDREITDKAIIEKIIKGSDICRLGLSYKDEAYIVPLNFGYKDNVIYVHTGKVGKKIDMINGNNSVCFEMEKNTKLVKGNIPCKWTMHFQTVIGKGKAYLVEDKEEKIKALDIITKHYGNSDNEFPDAALKVIVVFKIEIEKMTGKQSGYPELSKKVWES
ncbi:MAG: pyridoxamine 5'-phosphate oxidase family protein [bacterium]|nr:pyridoxamine 5'-phosphate oxidase family protein [bacterium]